MAKCKECGWEHPIIDGPCPAAKLKKMQDSDKGKKVAEFITKLTDVLHKSDNWEGQIRTVKTILKIQ